jgi:hypothetical protein
MDPSQITDAVAMTDIASIADAVWGKSVDQRSEAERTFTLQSYLKCCNGEKGLALSRNPHLLDETPLSALVSTIKMNRDRWKNELVDRASESSIQRQMTALDLAVRVAFMTACLVASEETFGGDLFRPRWQANESLTAYIARVYPHDDTPPQDVRPLRVDKLAMSYLTRYAHLELHWTHRMSDHLLLLKKANRKILYVFRHPAFLRVSLETLEANDPSLGQTISGALSL